MVASFLPWVTFRANIDFGGAFEGDMRGMQQFMEQAMTINGWNGHITLLGLTLPTWMVPIAAAAVAMLAWLRSADIWETPRWVGIALATFCILHLGVLLVVVGANQQSVRLGFGSILAAMASLGMLGLTIFGREQSYEPVRMSSHGMPDVGRPLGRVEPHMD